MLRTLERWRRCPSGLVTQLDLYSEGRKQADAEPDVIGLVVYHLACIIFGDSLANGHLGPDGDVLAVWRQRPDREECAKAAVDRAILLVRPRVQRGGRGGARRRREPLRELTIDHLLEIYVTVSGDRPTVNVFPEGGTREKRISGPSIEFLELILDAVNLRTPRATLRRHIDHWNRMKRLI
jgi:hypothetical protein